MTDLQDVIEKEAISCLQSTRNEPTILITTAEETDLQVAEVCMANTKNIVLRISLWKKNIKKRSKEIKLDLFFLCRQVRHFSQPQLTFHK